MRSLRCRGRTLLGLVALIDKAIVPNQIPEGMEGPTSWLASIVLGLVGAAVGWLIRTACLGIRDYRSSTATGASPE